MDIVNRSDILLQLDDRISVQIWLTHWMTYPRDWERAARIDKSKSSEAIVLDGDAYKGKYGLVPGVAILGKIYKVSPLSIKIPV